MRTRVERDAGRTEVFKVARVYEWTLAYFDGTSL